MNESITRLVRTLLALRRRRRRVGQNGERGKRRRWPRCDDQLLRVAHLELAGAERRRLFKMGHPFLYDEWYFHPRPSSGPDFVSPFSDTYSR